MVFQYIDNQRDQIYKTYLDLHACPEPSGQEERTSMYLQHRLKSAGLKVRTFPGHWGFVAEIPGKSKEAVALRADMDAVVHEWEGKQQALHTCGHDAHSTMVLYTALALINTGSKPQQTIRFLFQPAEEIGQGALQMMESGVLANVTRLVDSPSAACGGSLWESFSGCASRGLRHAERDDPGAASPCSAPAPGPERAGNGCGDHPGLAGNPAATGALDNFTFAG